MLGERRYPKRLLSLHPPQGWRMYATRQLILLVVIISLHRGDTRIQDDVSPIVVEYIYSETHVNMVYKSA
jgi:hypothetical protein